MLQLVGLFITGQNIVTQVKGQNIVTQVKDDNLFAKYQFGSQQFSQPVG